MWVFSAGLQQLNEVCYIESVITGWIELQRVARNELHLRFDAPPDLANGSGRRDGIQGLRRDGAPPEVDRRGGARAAEKLRAACADKPMPLIIGDVPTLSVVASVPDKIALRVIERFWPGPLTILFAAKKTLPDLITGGTGKVALRVPGSSFALYLARAVGYPITATSANLSGEEPIGDPFQVESFLGKLIDLTIDGGILTADVSSVVSLIGDEPVVLRKGVGDVSWCT